MRHISLAASAAVLAFASAATAASNTPWTGWYAGANAGYGFGDAPTSVSPNALEGNPIGTVALIPSKSALDGFLWGVQGGYNYRMNNNLVAGLETDFDYSGASRSNAATGPSFIGGTFRTTIKERLDEIGTLRARLGMLGNENLLLYGTGGLAYGTVKTTVTGDNPAAPNFCQTGANWCFNSSTAGVSVGWTAGAGAEYALPCGWSVKAEYLHIDLGSNSTSAAERNLVGSVISSTNSFSTDTIKVGLNYHF